MKKTIGILAAIALMAFTTEKFVTVKFTEKQMDFHWQSINQIKAIVDQSTLPHNQATFIIGALDSLQKNIQASAKLDSTTINKK